VRVALAVVLAGCGRLGFDAGAVDDAMTTVCPGPDEDGDSVGDACDNCPTEPNADQRDRGELDAGNAPDGVGDACDPRPALTGDYLALFEGFSAASDSFVFFGVRSYPGNGALRLGATGDYGQACFTTPATVTRVDIGFDVIDVSPTEIQWTGVWSEISPDHTDKLFSEMARNPASSFMYFHLKESSAGGDRYSLEVQRPIWNLGMRYRSVTDTSLATGGDYALGVTLDGAAIGQASLALGIPHGEEGYLESVEMTTDFTHLAVYAIR
jgi:hypothetical protein